MRKLYQFLGSEGFGTYEVDEGFVDFRRVGDADAPLLAPGFVDIHIHGAFGVDFMGAASADEVTTLCDRLSEQGYELFFPTTVTASAADVKRALSNLPDHPMIGGFHLEGPFISRSYPGAQPQEFIAVPPSGPSEWDEILDDPRLKVVTMAPEVEGALPLAKRLADRGVIVSMGHTNAAFAEAKAGLEAGFRHSTHTYNAMRPLHHREAGTVGFALSCDLLRTELIYDRLHVCKEAAGLLIDRKPSDGVVAVSDATLAAGMQAGQVVSMWGLEALVGDKEVRLSDGTLAGSGITLLDAFRNLSEDFSPEIAIRATSLNPRIALGRNRVLVYLEFDQDLHLVRRHLVRE